MAGPPGPADHAEAATTAMETDSRSGNRPPKTAWVLLGPTGSGKSDVARLVARRAGAEIVSVDSMKIYRRMDIGTAKPSAEQMREVRHHMVDVLDPWESNDVKTFVSSALEIMEDIVSRRARVLIEGGTALYLKALFEGIFEGPGTLPEIRRSLEERLRTEGIAALYAELAEKDPAAAARILPGDARRIVRALEVHAATGRPISELRTQFGRPREGWRFIIAGIARRRDDLYARIDRRVEAMIAAGWADECRALASDERGLSRSASQALGYGIIFAHIRGEISLDEAVKIVKKETRHFARKQLTWYRKFEGVKWLAVEPVEPPEITAERAMAVYEGRMKDAGALSDGPEII
jgi:tRNA dimethylallyltransferase